MWHISKYLYERDLRNRQIERERGEIDRKKEREREQ